MNIILASFSDEMISCWKHEFRSTSNVEIYHGSIFDIESDAIVSPSNSFGFMDGGLDEKISEFFGNEIQKRVQEQIKLQYFGELVVGTSLIIDTHHPKMPYLIVSPTMRVPMELGTDSVNIYLATRAALLLSIHGRFDNGVAVREKVKTITFSAMGTGVGKVHPSLCALQMRKAYDVTQEPILLPKNWIEAKKQHELLLNKIS